MSVCESEVLTHRQAIFSKCLYNTTDWHKGCGVEGQRAAERSKVTKRASPNLRLMCVVVCDDLCVGEHAYESVCLEGAEGEPERR